MNLLLAPGVGSGALTAQQAAYLEGGTPNEGAQLTAAQAATYGRGEVLDALGQVQSIVGGSAFTGEGRLLDRMSREDRRARRRAGGGGKIFRRA